MLTVKARFTYAADLCSSLAQLGTRKCGSLSLPSALDAPAGGSRGPCGHKGCICLVLYPMGSWRRHGLPETSYARSRDTPHHTCTRASLRGNCLQPVIQGRPYGNHRHMSQLSRCLGLGLQIPCRHLSCKNALKAAIDRCHITRRDQGPVAKPHCTLQRCPNHESITSVSSASPKQGR